MEYINDWNDIKIFLEAIETSVIIPDYFIRDGGVVERSVTLGIERMVFFSHPNWERVPLLEKDVFAIPKDVTPLVTKSAIDSHKAKALPTLPQKKNSAPPLPPKKAVPELPPKQTAKAVVSKRISKNCPYRSESSISGVVITVNNENGKEVLLSSNDTKVFTKFFQPEVEEEEENATAHIWKGSEMEIGIDAGVLNVIFTEKLIVYLHRFGKKRYEFVKLLMEGNADKIKGWKEKVTDRLKEKASETLGTEVKEIKDLSKVSVETAVKTAKDLQSRIQRALEDNKISFFSKAAKGSIIFPRYNSLPLC